MECRTYQSAKPKELNTRSNLVGWLKSLKKYVETENDLIDFLTLIQQLLISLQGSKSKILELTNEQKNQLEQIQEKASSILDLHSLGNLTLLDRATNSSLSNKSFINKRSELLELYYGKIGKEVFIPECTKDTFTKNFSTEPSDVTSEYFSPKDMVNYLKHIKNQLNHYLPEN